MPHLQLILVFALTILCDSTHAKSNQFGAFRRNGHKDLVALLPRGGSTAAKEFKRETGTQQVPQEVKNNVPANAAADVSTEDEETLEYRNTFVMKRDGRMERLDKGKV